MCTVPCLVIAGALFAVLAYYLYIPFPETASDPWLQSAGAAAFQVQRFLILSLEALGIATAPETARWTIEWMGQLVPYRPPNTVEVYETVIAGVDVMIFKPLNVHNGKLLPGLVYYHGGGWVFGSPGLYRPLTTLIAEEAEVIVVSVDYRLAPEHPFPVPFEDCWKVTKYLLQNGAKFSIDKNRIGVAGDSAGGNLAMAVTLNISLEADKNLPSIKFQGIFAGALQAFDFNLPSYVKYGSGPNWLRKYNMAEYWLWYLLGDNNRKNEFMENMHISAELRKSEFGERVSLDHLPKSFLKSFSENQSNKNGNETLSAEVRDLILDYRVSPILAPKEALEKLPATYIIGCEFDVLRDDSFIAYERMRKANVDLQHKFYRSEGHGFIWYVHDNGRQVAKEAISEFITFFKRTLKSYEEKVKSRENDRR